MKRYISLVLIFALIVTVTLVSAAGNKNTAEEKEMLQRAEGAQTVLNNGRYSFVLNNLDGSFEVADLQTNAKWYSNILAEDSAANGLGKQWLKSQMIVGYYNAANNFSEVSSYNASVKKSGLEVYSDSQNVRCDFSFEKEKFKISIKYTLTDSGLKVSIPSSNIKEEGECRVESVMLLPYFGAVENKQSGYIFVPDGCGAVIELTEEQREISSISYEKSVYGKNEVLSTKTQAANKEELLFPVFASCAENSLIGVITEGDSLASLNIIGEGNKTSYSAVRPVYTVRDNDTIVLYEGTSTQASNSVYQENILYQGDFTVDYHLVTGKANYSEIANIVSEYYCEEYDLKKNADFETELRIETIGAVKKKVNRFGVPVLTDYIMTDFDEANDIIKELNGEGVHNIRMLYYGVYQNGIYSKMPTSAKLNSNMDKKSLNKLLNTSASIVPMIDLVHIYQNGNGISQNRDAARGVRGTNAYHQIIASNSGKRSESVKNYYICRATELLNLYSKVIKANQNNGFKNFGDSGIHTLSSDYTKKAEYSRQYALEKYNKVMASVKNGFKDYTVDEFYGYMLPYVTDISHLPINSSLLEAFSYDVPFAQLVISGIANYGTQPLNYSSNTKKSVMKLMEYGCNPSFRIIDADRTEINSTYIQDEIIGCYDEYSQEMVTVYNELQSFYDSVGGRLISHERIALGVYVSEYESGKKAVFNYNQNEFTWNGVTVLANSYQVI